jgi:ATP-dependent DNA ligase
MYIEPMLASPMREGVDFSSGWVAEEKYDGHRMCVYVNEERGTTFVKMTARGGLVRIPPVHISKELVALPVGIYDGELISTNKTKAYGVTELAQQDHLQLVLFDILESRGVDLKSETYDQRREILELIINALNHGGLLNGGITISKQFTIRKVQDVHGIAAQIWARGGEGLVLKHRESLYTPKKRSKLWLKVKQVNSAVLTVKGFVAGLLGPCSTVLLEDKEGHLVTVKTLNTKERKSIEKNPVSFVGRKLCIEFQERTPDGSYRHPMWDHWEA